MWLRRNIIVLGFLSCLVLNSCGFEPLYAENNQSNVSYDLSSILLPEAKSRTEQIFTTELSEILYIKDGGEDNKKYRLEFSLKDSNYPLAIQQDNTITRYEISVDIEYRLINQQTRDIVAKGFINRKSGYDRVESDYSTYVSKVKSTEKAITSLASDVRSRLALSLSK